MEALITSSLRAIRSLFTPGMGGIFFRTLLVTIIALIGFITFSGLFFNWLSNHMQATPLASALPWIATFGSTVIAWFLFPGIMPVIVNFFYERIANIIEREDYPANLPTVEVNRRGEFWHDLRFSLWAIVLNIVVLPLYLLPGLNLFLFYGLNGYLLGREFFIMAARRHLSIPEAEALRKKHGPIIMGAGIALTFLATIPLVNFFAPFWGIAVMVHLYQRLKIEALIGNF